MKNKLIDMCLEIVAIAVGMKLYYVFLAGH